MKADGYSVAIVYIWLRSVDVSVRRVAERVQRGGHHVPEDDVRRRYERGVSNFLQLYRPLADLWVLCDNSDAPIRVVAQGTGDRGIEVFDQETYDEIHGAPKPERSGR